VQDISGATEMACNSICSLFDPVECDDTPYHPGCHAEIEH